MNDIRRTILWVIFGFSMVLLWDQWQVHNGQKPTFFPGSTNSAKSATSVPATSAASASSVPSGSPSSVPSPIATGATGVPGVVAAPGSVPPAPLQPARQRLVVTTDVFTLTFDTEGGSLIKSSFNKFKDQADKDHGFILLDESANRIYVAQTGLIAGSGGVALPTHKTVMTVAPGERDLKDGQSEIVVKFESPEVGGVKLVKTYTLHRGAYDIAVRHDIVNVGTTAVTPQI